MALRLAIVRENDETGHLEPLLVDAPLVEVVAAELAPELPSRWGRREPVVRVADVEAAIRSAEAALKRRTSEL